MGHIMVVAGEVSGDIHAANVVKKIKEYAPDTEFSGMGSTHLKTEGVDILIDPTEVSTIGFMEAFKNIKTHLSHLKLLKQHMKEKKPDVVFLVDYSGFNMMMARVARKINIPVVNYFPPSAWVWGKWRARWMARSKATIASVFPMERDVYLEAGADVKFVGHPLLDIVDVDSKPEEIYKKLELDPKKSVIGLMPGSRSGEISKLLPEMLKAAEKLQNKNPDLQFVLPLAPEVDQDWIAEQVASYNLVLKIVEDYTYQVMEIADLIIATSGTVTLEAAIIGTPMIIIYQTSWSTYKMANLLIAMDYIGLPNIIAGKEIVPELIQEKANAQEIYQATEKLLNQPYLLKDMEQNLNQVKKKLGGKGAVGRTAKLVLKEGNIDCVQE